ncbi:hypothetical protein [Gordonia sp. (in: high G+C Gram-positive bacteria)]|uniref:hypothetical protein n=1 Tax=Gordonia sp. (in: high G+C Gram-positive bacteria) TaxID=84139 RepID=UPI003529B4B0
MRSVLGRSSAFSAAAAATAALAACSAHSDPTPAATTPTHVTSSVPSGASVVTGAGIVDVDPAEYAVPGSPGYYRWKVPPGTGADVCGISPGVYGSSPAVMCRVTLPQAAPIKANGFVGPPSDAQLTEEGVTMTISPGATGDSKQMPVNRRIRIGAFSCTTLPVAGVDCSGPIAGFRYARATLDLRGRQIPAIDASSPLESPGCAPSARGTQVVIRRGSVSCTEAIRVIEGYQDMPDDGSHGNTRIMQYEGWDCASPTYASAVEKGYGTVCSKGDDEVVVPFSG